MTSDPHEVRGDTVGRATAAAYPPPIGVSVVIVSYNTREWLGTCIESIGPAAESLPVEVIVVDNASADGSADAIAAAHPQVRMIRNSKNAGFAKAVNQGAAVATGEYLLLLNPDGYLKPGAINALVTFARAHPEYVAYGGRTVSPSGELDPRSCWAAPTVWSLFCFASLLSTLRPNSPAFNPEAMGSFRRDHTRPVDIVTGCLLLMSLADWKALDGFDERYFVYGEDADLCVRAKALTGRQCVVTPQAEMVHAVGASSASRPDKLELLFKGRITYARTHLPGWQGRLGTSFIVLGVWVRAMLERIGASPETSWLELWRRRDKWRLGYGPADSAAPQVTIREGSGKSS